MDNMNSWLSGVAQHALGHIMGVAALNLVGLIGIVGVIGGVFEGLTTPIAALRSPVPMPAWSLLLFLLIVGAVPTISIVRRLQKDLSAQSALILELGGKTLRSLEGSRIVPAIVDRVSPVTYQDIVGAVESAQGSELDSVAEQLVGTRVEWLCYLQDGHKEVGDYFRVYLAVDEHGGSGTIHCDVRADEFKEISSERKRKIRVVGKIRQVGRWSVELEEVRLTLYGH